MKSVFAAMTAAVALMGASSIAMAGDPATEVVAMVKADGGDCLACHAVDHKVVGPAWKDVAARYKGDKGAEDKLVEKITRGGKGNWDKITGGMAMVPHPTKPTNAQLHEIVKLILALK